MNTAAEPQARLAIRAPGRWMWPVLLIAAAGGTVLWATLSDSGQRAGWSWLGGFVLAVGAFEFGLFNIRLVDRYVPSMTMAVAMFSYLITAIALGLILAASSPRVVDGTAISTGLFAGLSIWLAGLIDRAWFRQETHDHPVNIALPNDYPIDSP